MPADTFAWSRPFLTASVWVVCRSHCNSLAARENFSAGKHSERVLASLDPRLVSAAACCRNTDCRAACRCDFELLARRKLNLDAATELSYDNCKRPAASAQLRTASRISFNAKNFRAVRNFLKRQHISYVRLSVVIDCIPGLHAFCSDVQNFLSVLKLHYRNRRVVSWIVDDIDDPASRACKRKILNSAQVAMRRSYITRPAFSARSWNYSFSHSLHLPFQNIIIYFAL